ncbi:MAG: PqqD family protein, partial [Tepidiformaceae bacterium]
MELTTRLRVNAPSVIGESVDGEVLIVNLDSGRYYSASGSGDAIWRLAAAGLPPSAIVRELAASYDANPELVGAAVHGFIGQLIDEALLVEDSAAAEAGAEAATPLPVGAPAPFDPPLLNKYTDMEQLLLLDPVHEVDETGWPVAKATGWAPRPRPRMPPPRPRRPRRKREGASRRSAKVFASRRQRPAPTSATSASPVTPCASASRAKRWCPSLQARSPISPPPLR